MPGNRRHRTSTRARWLSSGLAAERKECGKSGGAPILPLHTRRADDAGNARAQRSKLSSYVAILPWVKVRHLASHLLGRVARRISDDWQQLYQHPIYLLETFIEPARFRGTCYRAANWPSLVLTTGRNEVAWAPSGIIFGPRPFPFTFPAKICRRC